MIKHKQIARIKCKNNLFKAKENLFKTLAIVLLANFQILLRHPRLAFDWLSVSFVDY